MPAHHHLTDEDLLAADDAQAFATFYRRHASRIVGYMMRATRDPEAAADLTAETFAAALIARERYSPDKAAARTWLFGIASHKLNDWRRRGYAEMRAHRRLGMERPELTDEDVREFERLAEDVQVIELVEGLPDDQRRAVHARVVDEREYGEIATELGMSEAAVRKRVSRGLATMRRRAGRGR